MWLALTLCAVFAEESTVSGTAWDYPESSKWGRKCATGDKQSPVDLPQEVQGRSDNLDAVWDSEAICRGKDTGHSIRFHKPGGSLGTLQLDQGSYDLKYFEFHTQAEHTVNGMMKELEVQFFHEKSGDPAVVALLCDVAGDIDLSSFFDPLRSVELGQEITVDLGNIFNTLNDKLYYSYEGSLTHPPCTEGVEWRILGQTCKVPQDFMEWLKSYDSMKSNYRQTQDGDDARKIKTGDSEDTDDPEEETANVDDTQVGQVLALKDYHSVGIIVIGGILCCGFSLIRRRKQLEVKMSLLEDADEL